MDINHLLKMARAGNQDAESRLLQYLSARFRLLAEQRVENKEVAEDIAQTACMAVLSKYRTQDFTKGFEPWAYGILRMKIGNHYQKRNLRRSREAREVESSGRAADADIDPDLLRQMLVCLKKIFALNTRYARTLVLAYQGYTADDICRRLEVSRQNHYSNLHRARGMLRHCLETGGP